MKYALGTQAFIAFLFGLFMLVSPTSFAKGATAVAARAAPATSARSYSTPTRSYSSTRKAAYVPSTTSTRTRKDDDVECSTLRNSRHVADREVYRRYC